MQCDDLRFSRGMPSTRRVPGVAAVFCVCLGLGACSKDQPAKPDPGDFARLMNIGRAHVENRESAQAIAVLERAVQANEQSPQAWRNLGRAYLIDKTAEQAGNAINATTRALKLDSASAAANYLLALGLKRQEKYEAALPHFEEAVRLDPRTPALRFQLGRSLESMGRHDEAHTQFIETIQLDPMHRFAYYRLAAQARAKGDREGLQKYTLEFQRLKKLFGEQPDTVLEQCIHTEPESLSATPSQTITTATPAIDVRFVDTTAAAFPQPDSRSASLAAVLEVDQKGIPSLFVVASDGSWRMLRWSGAGGFAQISTGAGSPEWGSLASIIAADFYSEVPQKKKFAAKEDVLNDVFLIGPAGAALLEQVQPGQFENRTASSGMGEVSGTRGQWADYDHDGDLDLLVAGPDRISLLQNNGDRSFEDVTEQVGINPAGVSTDAVAVDLDGESAVDLIIARGDQPTQVFLNQRAGKFKPMPQPPGPWPRARRVFADDLDNDGVIDLLLMTSSGITIMYDQGAGRSRIEFTGFEASSATLIDYDNDGWLDIAVAGQKGLRLWRGSGDRRFEETSEAVGINTWQDRPVKDLIAADVDGDGDSDLLVLGEQGLSFLKNEGGNSQPQLKLRLVSILTNPTCLGAKLEIRDRDRLVSRLVTRLPIEIGLGGIEQMDTVRVVWTNGVVDNKLDVVQSAEPIRLVEKMVEAGSCGFLFAWNGSGFDFVTDTLGNSPLGLSLKRNVLLDADPDEFVLIGHEKDLASRGGKYVFEMAECYREVLYVDQVHLVAVDHAVADEVFANDKLMPAPFPKSRLWQLESMQPASLALGDDGIDRTEAVQAIDGQFAPPGPPMQIRGMCQPMALTMQFDATEPGQYMLALTGWLRYGSASVNIAMSQNNSLSIIPPKLEIEQADGTWQPIDAVVGMPAGKTKTILCPLGELEGGPCRLRLTTTFEIRWDRIAIGRTAEPIDDLKVQTLAPDRASIHWLGFPEMKSDAPGHPITPDYANRSDQPPWREVPQGWCTRYGDVTALLSDRDDQLVILNSGDSVSLEFDSTQLQPVPPGMARSFFFYSVGWDRDMDHNVVGGDQVLPLPAGTTSDSVEPEAWRIEYNTRWVPRDRFKEPV